MSAGTVLTLAVAAALVGCAATQPPRSQRLQVDKAISAGRGALLIVDVCLNESVLTGDDYFVTENSRHGAETLSVAVSDYLESTGVIVRARLVPFVCGAIHGDGNTPKRFSRVIDGTVLASPQPFDVLPSLGQDPEYLSALQNLSTHIYRSALLENARKTKGESTPPDSPVTIDELNAIVKLISQRADASSIVYIGVTGSSLSSGKAAATGIARLAIWLAASVAIGPIFRSGGTQYGVVLLPGGASDARQMVAGTIDLTNAALGNTNLVHGAGDPMKSDVLTESTALQLLLRGLVFGPSSTK